jgi:predicted nucleic acid-binding protein
MAAITVRNIDDQVKHRLRVRAVVVDGRMRAGLPIQSLDAQIAAICLVEEATLATRNTKDFVNTGVELVNPWGEGRTGLWILSQGLGWLAIRLSR